MLVVLSFKNFLHSLNENGLFNVTRDVLSGCRLRGAIVQDVLLFAREPELDRHGELWQPVGQKSAEAKF